MRVESGDGGQQEVQGVEVEFIGEDLGDNCGQCQ